MKQNFFLVACLVLFASLSSCKKDNAKKEETFHCALCKTTPDALAVNDAISKGVYKGVVIGSTGTISFNVMNGAATITAIMVLDGVTVNLTSSISWVSGQAYVAPFTGTLNGTAVTINFKVDANGGNPVITSSSIPGHPNAYFALIKEGSTSLIECFEGRYETTKPDKGTFNILLSRSLKLWGGSTRKDSGTNNGDISGTISSDGKLLEHGTDYIGTLKDDAVNGTFKDNSNNTVTVTARRTL